MSAQPEPSTERRPPLSRDRVLRAAIDLADANGIADLTMRRLAQELGVEAMTLYYYVSNKDDILAGMVDLVLADFELPEPGDEWKAALRRTAVSAHATLVRHTWAANLMFRAGVGQARLRYMDGVLGCLRGAGFSAEMTHHAYHAMDSHILGFTLWAVGITTDDEDLAGMASVFLANLDRAAYPHLAEHVEWHIEDHPQEKSEFEFGLDILLDGLEELLEAESGR